MKKLLILLSLLVFVGCKSKRPPTHRCVQYRTEEYTVTTTHPFRFGDITMWLPVTSTHTKKVCVEWQKIVYLDGDK